MNSLKIILQKSGQFALFLNDDSPPQHQLIRRGQGRDPAGKDPHRLRVICDPEGKPPFFDSQKKTRCEKCREVVR